MLILKLDQSRLGCCFGGIWCLTLSCFLLLPGTALGYTRSEQFPGLSGYSDESFLFARYSMAYHGARDQMILLVHGIKERFEEGTPSRLFFWQDGMWHPLPGVPAAAGGLSVMGYDTNRRVMVFWQGRGVAGTEVGGFRRIRVGWTWEWDGANWRLASDRGSTWDLWPDKQWRQALVEIPYGGDMEDLRASPGPETEPYYGVLNQTVGFDPRRGRVVMLGGLAALNRRIDGYVYEWDGTAWKRMIPLICDTLSSECAPLEVSPGPLSIQAAAMAFHPPSGRMIIHGGNSWPSFYFFTNRFSTIRFETYSYDGDRIVRHNQQGPFDLGLRRAGHAMVYDQFADRLVMFGGQTANPQFIADPDRGEDCWNIPTDRFDRWDGEKWIRWPMPATVNWVATSKYLHAAAYDPKRHEMVIFGGLYNYRFERNPFQKWYDCLFIGRNATWRIGFSEVWVDSLFKPTPDATENGSFDRPWINIRRALDSVSSESHAVIRLKPGSGGDSSSFTINQPRVLEAPLGPVTIGK